MTHGTSRDDYGLCVAALNESRGQIQTMAARIAELEADLAAARELCAFHTERQFQTEARVARLEQALTEIQAAIGDADRTHSIVTVRKIAREALAGGNTEPTVHSIGAADLGAGPIVGSEEPTGERP